MMFDHVIRRYVENEKNMNKMKKICRKWKKYVENEIWNSHLQVATKKICLFAIVWYCFHKSFISSVT